MGSTLSILEAPVIPARVNGGRTSQVRSTTQRLGKIKGSVSKTLTSKKNSSDSETIKEILQEYQLIVDSCEQPIERPRAYEEQKNTIQARRKIILEKINYLFLPRNLL